MALLAAVHFQDGDLSGHKSVLTYLTPGHRPAQGLVLQLVLVLALKLVLAAVPVLLAMLVLALALVDFACLTPDIG